MAESTVRQYVRKRKIELGLVQSARCSFRKPTNGARKARWTGMKRRPKSTAKSRKSMCSACGAWPAAERFTGPIPHASQQAFLEAHELAFEYFGGVFKILRFDNLGCAVKKILRGHQREETERFIAFRSHWGFRIGVLHAGQRATKRAAWKEKTDTFGGIIWCRCRRWLAGKN